MTRALAVLAATYGVLMGVSPVLQIRRMVVRKSSSDVSVGYFGILTGGFVLWLLYGLVDRKRAPDHHERRRRDCRAHHDCSGTPIPAP
jgi:uncharacterized protein with PQ loop repeat